MENMTKRPEKCNLNHTSVSEKLLSPTFQLGDLLLGRQQHTHTQRERERERERELQILSGPDCINTQAKVVTNQRKWHLPGDISWDMHLPFISPVNHFVKL
jgi:hypothetical protein